MSDNHGLLIPGSRNIINQLKDEVIQEEQVILPEGYQGDMLTSEAGKLGGKIGGNMIQKMVQDFEEKLVREEYPPPK